MRKFFLLLTVIVLACTAHAQQITFRTSYDIALLDIPGNVIQNPQGNYVLAGTNTSFIPLYGNVTQLDTIGNVMWSKGYSAGSVATDLWDIKNVSGGGYIATGSTGSGLLLMRLDATGTVTWANRYRVSSSTDEHGQRVIQTSDGGFVVAGYVYEADPDGGGTLARQDSANLFCMKVNSSGVLQWAKVFFVSTSFTNDHALSDVAEVSDGYIFTGYASVSANDDDGTYGIVLKTDVNGNFQYLKRYGSTSSEGNAIVALSGSEVMISGDDNSASYYLRLSSSGTVNSGNKYSFGFINIGIPYNGYVTNDGQFAFNGMYIAPLSFTFASYVMKVNSSNGNVIFSRGYNSGLSSILPQGTQAQDSGYIAVMTAQQMTGFNYHVIKTDKNGFMNNVNCDTTIFTSPTKSSYGPSLTSIPDVEISGATTTALSIIVATLSPTQVIECLNVPCNPPANPTVSATPDTICSGQTSYLNATGSGNAEYDVYTQAIGGTSIGMAPMNVTPTSTTTYYVEAASKSTPGCVSSRVPITVTVNNIPGAVSSITGATTPCLGNQAYAISSVSGATSYSWSVSGGGTITSGQGTTSIQVNWTSSGGPYTVSVTASNSCGNTSKILSVTVSAGVTGVNASASPNPACVGDNVSLNGSGSGVSNWSWSGPNGFTSNSQNPTISNITSNEAGTYTLTASSTCGSGTANVTIAVNDKPQNVSASGSPNPACKGNTINLTGNTTNATSWTWNGPNGYSSNQQSPSISNVQTNQAGLYTLSAINACGSNTDTFTLVVNDVPAAVTANANPNPVCVGTTVNLSGSASGANSFSWSGPASFSSSVANDSVPNFQQANVGSYTLTATNTCGSSNASVSVTISSGPTGVSASASLSNICFGNTLTLTGNANGATSYSWTGPNGFTSNLQNQSLNNITLADSGLYTFTATNSCGTATSNVSVDVDSIISNLQVNATPDDTICDGGTINLFANGNQVNNWSWSGPNNFTATQQNTSIGTATTANTGNYIVTASNACGSVADTLFVLVNTVPLSPGTISGTATTCGNDTDTYSITNLTNATSYQWAISGGGQIISSTDTTSIQVVWGNTNGSYTLSVTASNNCGGSAASTTTVQVLPPAPVMNNTIIGDTGVCPGSEVYTINSVTNATGYNWTLNGGGSIVNGQNSNSVTVNWTSAGTHTLNVTATNSCGNSAPATLAINVHPSPTPATVSLSNDTICEGNSTTITASNSTGGTVNYNFYDAATGGNLVGVNPLTVSPTVTTVYYLELTNEFGCTGSSGRTPVTVYVLPAPSILSVSSANDTVCYNTGTTLTATATPGATVSWWDSPIGGSIIDSGYTYQTGNLQISTTYYVQATTLGGCQNLQGRVPVLVDVTPLPSVTLSSDKDNNTAFPGEAITFTANPSGYSNYEFFVNGESVQSGPENTWATAKLSDKDTVSVIATDNGCNSTKAEIVVTIADFPNAFTPNGDGVNDVFLKNYDLVIMNRWGQELYHGMDGWDGTYHGKKVSAGTYFYIVTLKNITDRDTQVKGTVLLIQE